MIPLSPGFGGRSKYFGNHHIARSQSAMSPRAAVHACTAYLERRRLDLDQTGASVRSTILHPGVLPAFFERSGRALIAVAQEPAKRQAKAASGGGRPRRTRIEQRISTF